jgi:Kinase non-catalytic C-lobe domain
MDENEKIISEKMAQEMPIDSSPSPLQHDESTVNAKKIENSLELCCDKDNCLSLDDILRSFNAPLSEEQAWSLIYQTVLFYRNFIRIEFIDKHTKKDSSATAANKSSHRIKVPKSPKNLNIHKDGTVHINDKSEYLFLLIFCRKTEYESEKSIEPLISLKQLLTNTHTQKLFLTHSHSYQNLVNNR